MILMSIDASTKSTGIAIFDNENLIYWDCLVNNDKNVLNRIIYMADEICTIAKKYKVNKVMMEDVLPADVKHNQKVFNALHYLQAAIVLTLFKELNQEVNFMTPSEWRSKCAIHQGRSVKREEQKQNDMSFVSQHYSLEVNDDVADAICIGWAAINGHKKNGLSFI